MNGQGVRGLVGQGMNGQRPIIMPRLYKLIDAGAGVYTITEPTFAQIMIWGGGGGGQGSFGGGKDGGNSGAAIYREIMLTVGETLTVTGGAGGAGGVPDGNGQPGQDLTLVYSRGIVDIAGGGSGGGVSLVGVPRAAAGAIVRFGSLGSSTNGTAGEDGGRAGGTGGGSTGGGGGGPGFASLITGLTYGAGSGGDGHNNGTDGGNGAAGRFLAYLFRL